PGGVAEQSFQRIRAGAVIGGGVETAIGELFGWGGGNRYTLKLEYLYVDFGRVSNVVGAGLVPVCANTCAVPATGSTTFVSSVHVSEQIIRLGLNYKFDR